MKDDNYCTCKRVETDGCTEFTCIYHGEENREKTEEQIENCPYPHRKLKLN